MNKKLEQTNVKDLVDSFLRWMLFMGEEIYGNAYTDWWNKEGRKTFFKWGEKQGLNFDESDFDELDFIEKGRDKP